MVTLIYRTLIYIYKNFVILISLHKEIFLNYIDSPSNQCLGNNVYFVRSFDILLCGKEYSRNEINQCVAVYVKLSQYIDK